MAIDTYSVVTSLVNQGLSYRKVAALLKIGKTTVGNIYTQKSFNPKPLHGNLSKFKQYLPKNTFTRTFRGIKYFLNKGDEGYFVEKGTAQRSAKDKTRVKVFTKGDTFKIDRRTKLDKQSTETKDKAIDSHGGGDNQLRYRSSGKVLKIIKRRHKQ